MMELCLISCLLALYQVTSAARQCDVPAIYSTYCQAEGIQEDLAEIRRHLDVNTEILQKDVRELRVLLEKPAPGIWQEVFRFDTRWTSNVRDGWGIVFEHHLRHKWSRVKKVRYAMERDDVSHYVTFNAVGTSKESWFSQNRILDSSYTDLNTTSPTLHFSVGGWDYPGRARRFYIQRNHGGCAVDRGWFVVIDSDGRDQSCSWDNPTATDARPLLLFSPGKTSSLSMTQYVSADYMTISVMF